MDDGLLLLIQVVDLVFGNDSFPILSLKLMKK